MTTIAANEFFHTMFEQWFQNFTQFFRFPWNYTTLDLETNGVDVENSLICTFGLTTVRDGQVAATREYVLDWTRHPDMDQRRLRESLEQTQAAMERRGAAFHHTYDYLREHGVSPLEALNSLLDTVERAEEQQEVLVAHNGWQFDIPMIEQHIHNWLRIGWKFEPHLVYDTGIAEKAAQLDVADHPLPYENEDFRSYSYRIGGLRRRGVYWSLDRCREKYAFERRFGLDPQDSHRAGHDSLTLYHLMETHRALAIGELTLEELQQTYG